MNSIPSCRNRGLFPVFRFVVTCLATMALLAVTGAAHAFPATQCAADRAAQNLNCTAGDLLVSNLTLAGSSPPPTCFSGQPITVDLTVTVSFGSADRYDVGVFFPADAASAATDQKLKSASGGPTTCSVKSLTIPPFQNLNANVCGDGGSNLVQATTLYTVTLPCRVAPGSGGLMSIPYVVSYDNNAGGVCNGPNDVVPGTTSKCNAPSGANASVPITVVPNITITDNQTAAYSGDTLTYTVVISNNSGAAMAGVTFSDPVVPNLSLSNVTCAGATCPAVSSVTLANLTGTGIPLPSIPNGGSLTFTIVGTVGTITTPTTLTNTANVTILGKTASVSDTDTVTPPMTCFTDTFSSGTLDTSLWGVTTISGSFLPTVVNVGGGDNRLRLTDTGGSESTFAQVKRKFPGAGNKMVLEVDYLAYGGTGADGIAVTFSDSAISSTTGAFGGSLGFAQKSNPGSDCTLSGGCPGFGGGWLGIGVDEYGNFPNPTEGRSGYPTGWTAPAGANAAAGFYKTNISIRGSGAGLTGYNLLANTGVLATPVAPASGAAGTTPYRYRFTIDHSDSVHAWVKVERDTTATGNSYTTLVPNFDVKAAGSGQVAVPANWLISFTGSTGGATNFHELKRVSVCAISMTGGGPDHLEIQHGSGTGLTCTPSTLTIKACADALVPCTPYTAGVSGALSAAGTPTVNWDGTTGGAAGAGFVIPAGSSTVTKNVQVTTVGGTVFGAASTPAASYATTCNFGTPGCTFTAADAGFIVTAPNHVAETSSTLTIQAVKKADNSLQCVPAFANSTKSVNLKCSYTNPSAGTLPVRVGGVALNAAGNAAAACDTGGANVSLTFNASGIATPALQYADVGNMLINASFTGTAGTIDAGLIMIGNGSFIAAPASFAFSGTTTGLIKAGNAFSATVTAQNASGATTPNFGKETAAEGTTLVSNLVSPVGGNNPSIGNSSISGGAFVSGVVAVNNLSWGEVGLITMTANLTSGSYLGSGLSASGTSGNVGRFIPDHFDTITSGGMPCPTGLTCPAQFNGFVYSGQAFTTQVTARNLGGEKTLNYDSALGYSKAVTLSTWNTIGGATANPGGGTLTLNAVPSTAFNLGGAMTSTPTYTFPTTPIAPTDIFIRATDMDNVTSLRGASVEGGMKVVSGRISISNAHGSELLPLQMTATMQYFNGSWVTSTTDNTTSFNTAINIVAGNIKGPLTAANISVAGAGAVTVAGGVRTFTLNRPGNTGSADISLSAPNYLLAGSNGAAVNPSIAGRVTFGVYKGNNNFIYLRENY